MKQIFFYNKYAQNILTQYRYKWGKVFNSTEFPYKINNFQTDQITLPEKFNVVICLFLREYFLVTLPLYSVFYLEVAKCFLLHRLIQNPP